MPSRHACPSPTFLSKLTRTALLLSMLAGSCGALSAPLCAQTADVSARPVATPVADRLTQAINEHARVTLPGTVHPLANKANDRGQVPDGMKLDRIQVVLKRSDAQEAALKRLIGDMHTQGSASYHKWLTPEDFGKQFGPSDADVAKLESWLGSHGFSVTKLNPGRQTLEFAGTAGQFRDAFHTQIHSYSVKSVNGLKSAKGQETNETHFANVGDPQIPAAIAPVFGGFASLNNFRLKSHAKMLGKAQFNPATHESKPDWTTGTADNFNLVLGPGDFAVQYDLNPLYTAGTKGDGQSIAIVNEANINVAEVNRYRALFGLPANPPQVIIDGNDPGIDGLNSPYGPNGASGEAYLDVEMAGAIAPNAQINLVIADSTALEDGLTLALERAVYTNISPIISLSFGDCEAVLGGFNSVINGLWEQAAAQGITAVVSTGDNGSAGCDNDNTQNYAVGGQAVSGDASTPYNVAVGGTDFYYSGGSADFATYWNLTPSNGAATVSLKSKVPEQPWNDSQYGRNLLSYYEETGNTQTEIAAGSGGASTAGLADASGNYDKPYPKPSWQTALTPADGARDIPDVSLFASNGSNNTYIPICAEDGDCEPGSAVQISGVGGTSASTPAFAGIMALVNQKYGRQGQANFVLYPLAKQFPTAFNDVTVGTITVPCATATVYDSYNGNLAIQPDDCLSVPGGYDITDTEFGETVEGEIGFGTTPAYNAGTGYDLATGLGTIDANNLVTNWNKVTFAATATTLTASPTSFVHGSSAAAISGSVTGTGTPTGNVALITTSTEPNNQGEDLFTLSGGLYSGNIGYLPGGTYTIYGYYGGDGVDAPSTSTPVQITVTPENSATSLVVYTALPSAANNYTRPVAASGSILSYGSLQALSAQAVPSSATEQKASYTSPTGSVIFLNGTTALNTAVVNAEGDAEYNSALPPGAYSVTAQYSGDASYNTSTSAAATFTVAKNKPTISTSFISDQNNNAIAGEPTYIGIQVENSVFLGSNFIGNPAAAAPSGTVTVTDTTTNASTTVTLVPAVDPLTGAPEGTGYYTIPATVTTAQNLNLTYNGDSNYSAVASPVVAVGFDGGGEPTTTTAVASATSTSSTAAIQATVSVTGNAGSGAPTGTLLLIVPGVIIGQINLPTSSSVTSTVTLTFDSSNLPQGTEQITAQYLGDSNYAPSVAAFTIANPRNYFSLVPATTIVDVPSTGTQTDTINLSSFNGFAGAVSLTCTAATGVTCTLNPTSVTLTSGSSAPTTLTVNTAGVPAAGTYNVVVTGTGPSGDVIHTIGLQIVTPVIPVSATPGFSLAGTAATAASQGASGTSTLTVTPTNGFTGTVTFTCAVTSSPSGASDLPTCSAAPATVTGTAAATATLTINTTAQTTAKLEMLPMKRIFTASGGVVLAALFFLGVPAGRRGRRSLKAMRAMRILSAGLLFALVAGAGMGCGGSSGGSSSGGGSPSGGTTTGNYTLTVTGTSGTTVGSTTVALTVN